MINRDSFINIMDALDSYFNGDILKAFDLLGIYENKIHDHFDIIVGAIDKDIDPEDLARADENTADCGSYVCEWLFGVSDFNEKCKTSAELYDYIVERYKAHKKA